MVHISARQEALGTKDRIWHVVILNADKVGMAGSVFELAILHFYMKIKREVLNNIEYVLGNASIESGGIIGGKDSIVTNFYFDINAKRNDKMYIPNVESLNEVIADWAKQKISFYGVVHSHPNGQYQLSANDIIYANKIITLFPSLEKNIYFPIITTNPTQLHVYKFDNGCWIKDEIILID